ncbi:MAG: hypothetical protein JW832_09445 [Deltaproteobacteria bacterium]|nr:hypothetical protein [Deltaproteobacteria bacterium]
MQAILKYIQEESFESKHRLAEYFSKEVEEFATLISSSIHILQNFQTKNPRYNPNDPQHIAYGLMTKGINTLMAGHELSLNGYFWEPDILLRNALEGFSVAWDIIHNEDRFVLWKGKKFDSAKSISKVKEVSTVISKLWGHLSNMYVHSCPLNASPSCMEAAGNLEFQKFGFIPKGKENTRKGDIYTSIFVAYICLQLTELCFYQYANKLETIELLSDSNHAVNIVSERHRKFVNKMTVHFKEIAEGKEKCC